MQQIQKERLHRITRKPLNDLTNPGERHRLDGRRVPKNIGPEPSFISPRKSLQRWSNRITVKNEFYFCYSPFYSLFVSFFWIYIVFGDSV